MYNFLQVVSRDHSSKQLSFWENHVLHFDDRQTNRQTEIQIKKPIALSRSQCVEFSIQL